VNIFHRLPEYCTCNHRCNFSRRKYLPIYIFYAQKSAQFLYLCIHMIFVHIFAVLNLEGARHPSVNITRCAYVCVFACAYACACACGSVCVRLCLCACLCVWVLYVRVFFGSCAWVYHTCSRICPHARAHTHTHRYTV